MGFRSCAPFAAIHCGVAGHLAGPARKPDAVRAQGGSEALGEGASKSGSGRGTEDWVKVYSLCRTRSRSVAIRTFRFDPTYRLWTYSLYPKIVAQ